MIIGRFVHTTHAQIRKPYTLIHQYVTNSKKISVSLFVFYKVLNEKKKVKHAQKCRVIVSTIVVK